ncbi:MAG: transketolase [Gammaproteobacteria bacterium]|nr:transketolase [Gammaproteobacteria bacterium]MBU1558937.1 transketolase [Gammaproteobacteria bacterium]MBU2546209.1 transketolase [Gammaproteobacteria bacterium]
MKKLFAKLLTKAASQNNRLFLITGDLGFGVLMDYAEQYPDQFLNVGVAEQNMTGVAAGLAFDDRVVFTYSIANFPTLRCLEQIRNDVCYHELNVKIVAVGGGFSYGAAGLSHHATEDLAIMRSLPITVVAPGDLWEVEQATQAIINRPGPCYLRLDNTSAPTQDLSNSSFQIGKARRILEGRDITLMAIGGGALHVAYEAAQQLRELQIDCRLVSMHTLNPLDKEEVLDAARQTQGVITVEEHTIKGGLGGAVAEICLESGVLPRAFYRIGLRRDYGCIIGSQAYLRDQYKISAEEIVKQAKALLT